MKTHPVADNVDEIVVVASYVLIAALRFADRWVSLPRIVRAPNLIMRLQVVKKNLFYYFKWEYLILKYM